MKLTLVVFLSAHAAASGVDMSATFAKLKTCGACIKAGYGWCPIKRRCGGFANKECGIGAEYVAHGYLKPKAAKKPAPSTDSAKPAKKPRATNKDEPRSTDMRATFAKLRDCGACVAAGYGWCPIKRICGGFANKECGIGPNYVAAAGGGGAASPSPSPPRNGLWESKRAHAAEAPPDAEVPAASPPPPASLLYAGPVSGGAASATSATSAATVTPMGSVTVDSVTISAAAAAPNASGGGAGAVGTARGADEAALMQLPHAALVAKVLELEAALSRTRAASTA